MSRIYGWASSYIRYLANCIGDYFMSELTIWFIAGLIAWAYFMVAA